MLRGNRRRFLTGAIEPAKESDPEALRYRYLGFESHQGLEDHKRLLFAGDIDEVLVFSRPLSDAEIGAQAAKAH